MGIRDTSLAAFQTGIEKGTLTDLRRRLLSAFLKGPATTWGACERVSPDNPDGLYKDATSAVNWLRRTGLVEPTGERRPGRTDKKAEVLAVPDAWDAIEFIEGRSEPEPQPTERELLLDVLRRSALLLPEVQDGARGKGELEVAVARAKRRNLLR